jgi:hypothetical protein
LHPEGSGIFILLPDNTDYKLGWFKSLSETTDTGKGQEIPILGSP